MRIGWSGVIRALARPIRQLDSVSWASTWPARAAIRITKRKEISRLFAMSFYPPKCDVIHSLFLTFSKKCQEDLIFSPGWRQSQDLPRDRKTGRENLKTLLELCEFHLPMPLVTGGR